MWPSESSFGGQAKLEQTYNELQAFASQLLSLLAISLGKDADYFSSWLDNSLSTLRLLHYPRAQTEASENPADVKLSEYWYPFLVESNHEKFGKNKEEQPSLSL